MVSVVIPTLDEESHLGSTIRAVRQSSVQHEILVVDGGSTDRTIEVAAAGGATTIRASKRQRAAQLNQGAAASAGEILLFLHADTILPKGGLDQVQEACARPSVGGGAFARRFDCPSVFLRLTCHLAEYRNRLVGWHLGDQGIFVRKSIHESLGGFRAFDRFEDLDFSRRLAGIARVVTLRPPVVSSDRRFQRLGPVRTTLRDFWLTLRYLRDDPEVLYVNGIGPS